jgi:hypothetical protein
MKMKQLKTNFMFQDYKNMSIHKTLIIVFLFIAMTVSGCNSSQGNGPKMVSDRIQPYTENQTYWQYHNQPILLIGGSSDDNLFQHLSPELDNELDRIKEFGGNYVRCTMSSRDSGNVYAYYLDPATQLYDLTRWDDEYWRRFDYFLKAAHDRQIIVQIEIWATYDFYTRDSHMFGDGRYAWDRNPYNPGNNINYTERESGLYEIFRSTHGTLINPFFATVLPRFEEVPIVLGFQQKFVDKLLSISLKYDHVLYCMDNETNADPEWGEYWARYVREKASAQNIEIEVTQSWDSFDPTDGGVKEASVQNPSVHFFTKRASVSNTLNNPDVYTFIEISNHNAQRGEVHYKTGHYVWNKVQESGILRPINNVKVYGAETSWAGSAQEGMQRFWRNVFAGSAAVRFHRPPSGLGSTDIALSNIKSMRMLTDSIDIFRSVPANELLGDRADNEAFCLANRGNDEYILYFPAEGNIKLDVQAGSYELTWLNIGVAAWQETETMRLPGDIKTPNDDQWAVLVRRTKG